MSRSEVAQSVRDVIGPAVAGAGLFLEDVVVTQAGSRSVVRVTVDLPEDEVGGVGLDRIADVSGVVSAALDERSPLEGAYVLEVSSPGTARPLTEPRHFRRARTRLVVLEPTDGGELRGRLVDVSAEGVVLEDAAGTRTEVPFAGIRRGVVEVELSRAATEEDEEA